MGHNVKSLKGLNVVFTGTVRNREGKRINRSECAVLATKNGARSVPEDLSLGTDVLVYGDLTGKVVTDKKHKYSEKLVAVAARRAQGDHVHVVDGDGFLALIRGERAKCLDLVGSGASTRIKAEPTGSLFGGVLDPKVPVGSGSGARLDVDLSGLDAGTRAHQQTLRDLVQHLAPVEVRSPGRHSPLFDAGWVHEGMQWIAEVKSLSGTNQSQQIRLGFGQILDYHQRLGARRSMQPVVVLQQRPEDLAHWTALAKRLGVVLTWGPRFPGLS